MIHHILIRLWFRVILSLPVMIRFVISIPCILGKVRPTEGCAYSIESAGDGTGMFSEAEYNPVGSYIKNLTWIRSFVVRELDCS